MLRETPKRTPLRAAALTLAMLMLAAMEMLAQHNVTGRVVDSKDRQPLIGATAVLTDKEGKNPQGQSTDENGNFTIYKIKDGSYILKVIFMGYQTMEKSITVQGEDVKAGLFRLKSEDKELKEVKAVGVMQRQEQKGDTTVFNAEAFKVNPDATTEDLLKKMPGMEVSNGSVTHGGETVKKVLVDGKEFFGSDPMLALKNIDASMVDKIEVYDKQSDQAEFTGISDGNEQRTINILTKMGVKSGRFGRVYGGLGTDKHYEAGGSMNYFRGDHRFTLLGALNNINQQGFSFDDISGAMAMGGGMRGGRRDGLNKTGAVGLNYSYEKPQKLRLDASYFFNYNKNTSHSSSLQEYFQDDEETTEDIHTYESASGSGSHNLNHRLNMRLRWTVGENDQININPAWSWQKYDRNGNSTGEDFRGGQTFQFTQQESQNKTLGYQISGDVSWNHKFGIDKRTLSIRVAANVNDNEADATSTSLRQYQQTPQNNLMTSQVSDNDNKSHSYSGRIMYTEPFGEHTALQINYSPSYRFSKGDKQVFADSLNVISATPEWSNYRFSQLLSNVKESEYLQHRAGVGLNIFNGREFNAVVGVDLQKSYLDGEQTYPFSFKTSHSFNSVMPNAEVRLQKGKTLMLRFNYRTSSSAPSISQLQNVIDVSNIRKYSGGNENLSQSTTHQLNLRGGANNPQTSRYMHFYASASFVKDYIATSSVIATKDSLIDHDILLPAGTQFTKPINMDGYSSARVGINLSSPIKAIGSNLGLSLGANMSKRPSMYNYKTVTNKEHSLNFGTNLSSSFSENVDFNIAYRGNYNITKSTQAASNDYNYYGHTISADLTCNFANQHLVFTNNLAHKYTKGMGKDDSNYLTWNASLGFKFLKQRQAELRLRVNDILDKAESISRSIQDAYVQTNRTDVLGRYAMLTFTYKFKQIGDMPAQRERMGGGFGGGRPPM